MRKAIFLVMALVLCACAFAANETLCTDSDSGGEHRSDAALKTKGQVKYGITTLDDTCLTSQDGVSTNSSKYLKEYYCRTDKREYEVYDCTSLGFSGCVSGECKGASSTAATGNVTFNQSTSTTHSSCGDKITEKAKGEECDPPGSICFGRTSSEYGSCQSDCKCKVAAAALKNRQVVCGDKYVDTGEECEADTDCQTSFVCTSCKCVKVLTAAEIEALKQNATSQKVEEKEEVEKEIDEKYKTTIPEVNLTATNFSDDAGIKATSSIANFFKKIFGWIGALFS